MLALEAERIFCKAAVSFGIYGYTYQTLESLRLYSL